MRFTLSKSLAIFKSSALDRVLPISRVFTVKPISLLPPKEVLPCLNSLDKASLVSACALRISSKSVVGTSAVQSFLPGSESANSVRACMIFVYSKVFKTFSFIIFPPNGCIKSLPAATKTKGVANYCICEQADRGKCPQLYRISIAQLCLQG